MNMEKTAEEYFQELHDAFYALLIEILAGFSKFPPLCWFVKWMGNYVNTRSTQEDEG